MERIEIRVESQGVRRTKGWVAEITGEDARYGLSREFVRADRHDGDEAVYVIEPNKVYEVQHPAQYAGDVIREYVHYVPFDASRHVKNAGEYVEEGWLLEGKADVLDAIRASATVSA